MVCAILGPHLDSEELDEEGMSLGEETLINS